MDGVHDLGGMHGLGPVVVPRGGVVFHEPWEARVFALHVLVGIEGLGARPGGRRARVMSDDPKTPDDVSTPRETKAARDEVPDMTRERARTERRSASVSSSTGSIASSASQPPPTPLRAG